MTENITFPQLPRREVIIEKEMQIVCERTFLNVNVTINPKSKQK